VPVSSPGFAFEPLENLDWNGGILEDILGGIFENEFLDLSSSSLGTKRLLLGDVGGLLLYRARLLPIPELLSEAWEPGDKTPPPTLLVVRRLGLTELVAWRARRRALCTNELTSSSDMVLFPPFSVLTSNVRDEFVVVTELDDGELWIFAPLMSDRDALTSTGPWGLIGETDTGEMGWT
jgi:hypothetical protein